MELGVHSKNQEIFTAKVQQSSTNGSTKIVIFWDYWQRLTTMVAKIFPNELHDLKISSHFLLSVGGNELFSTEIIILHTAIVNAFEHSEMLMFLYFNLSSFNFKY